MKLLSQIEHQEVSLFHSNQGDRVIRLNLSEFIEDNDEYCETTKHYVSYCPYCFEHYGYLKKKLYIEKETLDRGFCQRCHSIYFNYTTDLNFDVISSNTKYKQFTLEKLPKIHIGVDGNDYSLQAYEKCICDEESILTILSKRNLDKITNIGSDILIKRNITRYKPLIKKLGLKGTITGNDTAFIMIPFYINGEFVYWQSKLIGYMFPYFMPPIKHKPFYIPEFRGNKIVIVEGIFDAMSCLTLYPDRTPIAILGSYVTDYHIWLLRNYIQPVDCLISLDNIHLSMNVLFQLKGMLPTVTNYSCYYGKWEQDPDELLLSMNDDELKEFISTHRYANNFEWE